MGTVIQVFFKPHAHHGGARQPFELIETDFADLEQALIATSADELIVGQVLSTHRGEQGERIVHGAQPIGFRGGAVDRICLPTWKIVREVD